MLGTSIREAVITCSDLSMTDYPKRLMPVGDVHARPGDSLDHLTWAGRMAADHKVDTVLFLGDVGEFASFNPSLKPIEREGKRISEDIAAYKSTWHHFHDGIGFPTGDLPYEGVQANVQWIDGNHENYLEELIKENPKFEGSFALHDAEDRKVFSDPAPFLQPIDVYGFSCRHYIPVDGNPKRAQNSETYKFKRSCIVGHSHQAVFRRDHDEHNNPIFFINAGCWVSDEFYSLQQKHDYTYGSRCKWDRGLWLLDVVAPGQVGHYSWWPYEKVKSCYA